jgi:hypothetical protein
MPRLRPFALFIACAALAACTAAPSPLVPQLRQALQPGLTIAAAEAELKRHAATWSIKSAAECDEIGRKSAMAAQLPARGGPCIFGKIPVGTDWLGGRTDVIVQLVFTPDGRLADGNFEEIRSLR